VSIGFQVSQQIVHPIADKRAPVAGSAELDVLWPAPFNDPSAYRRLGDVEKIRGLFLV
jgi:hypothetical protein